MTTWDIAYKYSRSTYWLRTRFRVPPFEHLCWPELFWIIYEKNYYWFQWFSPQLLSYQIVIISNRIFGAKYLFTQTVVLLNHKSWPCNRILVGLASGISYICVQVAAACWVVGRRVITDKFIQANSCITRYTSGQLYYHISK